MKQLKKFLPIVVSGLLLVSNYLARVEACSEELCIPPIILMIFKTKEDKENNEDNQDNQKLS